MIAVSPAVVSLYAPTAEQLREGPVELNYVFGLSTKMSRKQVSLPASFTQAITRTPVILLLASYRRPETLTRVPTPLELVTVAVSLPSGMRPVYTRRKVYTSLLSPNVSDTD